MKRFLILVLALEFCSSAWAFTREAVTCGNVDVQNAINASQNGDTVIIPSGTCDWTTPVIINLGWNITLIGKGSLVAGGVGPSAPKITGDTIALPTYRLQVTVSNANTPTPKTTMRIANINFDGVGNVLWITGAGTIDPTTFKGGIRIDHNRFGRPYYDGTGFTITDAAFTATQKTVQSSTGQHHFTTADNGRVLYGTGIGYYAIITSPGSPDTIANVNVANTGNAGGSGTVGFTGFADFNHQELGERSNMSGWVFGVWDHNEMDGNLLRKMTSNSNVNNNTNPSGVGFNGDYACSYSPNSTTHEWGGQLDSVVFEDNIIHRGCGAFVDVGDGPGVPKGGGSFVIARHNTTFGVFATHGSRETGGYAHGASLMEYYNNLFCTLIVRLEQKQDTAMIEGRDGEQIIYNNTLQIQTGGSNSSDTTKLGLSPTTCGATTVNKNGDGTNNKRMYFGADGLNPLDDNAKGAVGGTNAGAWFDANNNNTRHDVYAGYTRTWNDNTSLFYLTGQQDQVTNGVDTDPRMSDVFGIVSGGQLNPNGGAETAGGNTTLTNVIITGTNLPPDLPANYFRGFTIVNADLPRYKYNEVLNAAKQKTDFPFSLIKSSTAGPGGNSTTSVPITLTLLGCNPCDDHPIFGYHAPSSPGASHTELRKVQNYWALSGSGPLKADIVLTSDNTVPLTYTDGLPVHYVAPWYNGNYGWWNVRRFGNTPGTYYNSKPYAGSDIDHGYAGFAFFCYEVTGNQASPISGTNPLPLVTMTNNTAVQALFNRGYHWDPTVPAGSTYKGSANATKIGADWVKTFIDPVTQLPVFSNDPAVTTGGPNGNGWPEFVSYFHDGVGGDQTLSYPHPLVIPPAATAPTFNPVSLNPTSYAIPDFTAGIAGTYTFGISGTLPMTSITQTGVPAGATFTPTNSNGTAVLNWPSPVQGNYTITLNAANGTLPNAVQAYTLAVNFPITVNLTAPPDGTFYLAPASIPMTATITNGSGSETVDFYDAATKLGSDSTSTDGYTFNYSNVPKGTYDLHAKVGTTDSKHHTVTVGDVQPTPTPGQIMVKPGTGSTGPSVLKANASGIYLLQAGQLDATHGLSGTNGIDALDQSYIEGVRIKCGWADVETADGTFDWSFLKSAVAYVHNKGKKCGIDVGAGLRCPNWLYLSQAANCTGTAGTSVASDPTHAAGYVLADTSGNVGCQIPVPNDPVFMAQWHAFITELGKQFDNDPDVRFIIIEGIGNHDEWNTANGHLDTLALGHTTTQTDNWRTSANQIVDWYATAFPHTIVEGCLQKPFSSASGDCPIDPWSLINDVVTHALSSYKKQFAMCNNGLNNGSTTGYPPNDYINNNWTTNPTGGQSGPVGGQIKTDVDGSLTSAEFLHMRYVELYPQNISPTASGTSFFDSTWPPMLTTHNNTLKAFPPPTP